MDIKRNLKDYWLWLIFGVFVFLTIIGVLHHESWRDEAQSWLIVRDLNFWQVIRQMPYEGQPPLWHFLLFPMAKIGLPYISQSILHLFLASFAIWVFLFYSPFSKLIKFILPFSYFFLFEYAVVARNYVLVVLFLFLIASLYEQRLKRPWLYASLIALLSFSSIHAFFPAVLLAVEFIYSIIKYNKIEKKFVQVSIFLPAFLMMIIFLLLPYTGQQYNGLHINNPISILNSFSVSLFPSDLILNNFPWYLKALLGLIWLPLLYLLRKKESWYFWLGSVAWLEFIFIFKNQGYLRHFGLLFIFFVFAFWIDLLDKERKEAQYHKIAQAVFLFVLVSGVALSARIYTFDYTNQFSGAKELALYIQQAGLDKYPLVSYPSYLGSSLLPYLPDQKIYQLDREEYGTFLTWDKKFMDGLNLPYVAFKNRLIKQFSGQEIIFIANWPANLYDKEAELVFSNTQPVYSDENFSLFKYNLK